MDNIRLKRRLNNFPEFPLYTAETEMKKRKFGQTRRGNRMIVLCSKRDKLFH